MNKLGALFKGNSGVINGIPSSALCGCGGIFNLICSNGKKYSILDFDRISELMEIEDIECSKCGIRYFIDWGTDFRYPMPLYSFEEYYEKFIDKFEKGE